MARKFLIGIAIIVGLAVLGSVLFRLFPDQILSAFLVPGEPFAEESIPAAPDYAEWSGWAVGDPGADTPADMRPPGATYDPPSDVAIFYVHPTSYWAKANWNGPIDEPGHIKRLNELYLSGQASLFAPYGRLYAPYYRQAALGAFLARDENMVKSLQVAYGDVARAFDAFLDKIGPDTPFILAGHSQGTLHLLTLLHTKVQPLGLTDRMIAAYLVGWPISESEDMPATIPACDTPEQTRCAISWQTFGPEGDAKDVERIYDASPSFTGKSKTGTPMLCVNPLTFDRSVPEAPATSNIGGVPAAGGASTLAAASKGLVGAQCNARGILFLDRKPGGTFDNLVLPGENYHPQDLQLFYRNIQANLAERIAAFTAAGK